MTKKVIILLAILMIGISAYAYIHLKTSDYHSNSVELSNKKWLLAKPDQLKLQTGDLVFRHGHGIISESLMKFSRRKAKYSHAGIISIENNKTFVYHAIGGEENRSNKLRKDPIELYCSPVHAKAFGIYRLDLDHDQLRQLDSIANRFFQNGIEFDTKFDLKSDDRMYCTEFVYKVIEKATGDKNFMPLSYFSGINYISCDDLYLNSHCNSLYSYHY